MERAEVGRHAIGSITLGTGHLPIMEEPGKVAAFINLAAMAVSTK